MSFYFEARKPLGYMQDMFTLSAKAESGSNRLETSRDRQKRTDEKKQRIGRTTTFSVDVNAETVTTGKKHKKKDVLYFSQTKQPFWSRLLCHSEVYDPYIEAAPTGRSLSLDTPSLESLEETANPTNEQTEEDFTKRQRSHHSHHDPHFHFHPHLRSERNKMLEASLTAGEVTCTTDTAESDEKIEIRATSPLCELVAEEEKVEVVDNAPVFSSSVSDPDNFVRESTHDNHFSSSRSDAGEVEKRNIFVVSDTRVCAARSLNHRLNATRHNNDNNENTDGAVNAMRTENKIAIPLSPHLVAKEQKSGMDLRSAPAVYFDDQTEDYEEKERRRMQNLVQKRWRKSEQVKRHAKKAREARLAIRTLALEEQVKQFDNLVLPISIKDAATVASPMDSSPSPDSSPPAAKVCEGATDEEKMVCANSDVIHTLLSHQHISDPNEDRLEQPNSPTTSSLEGSAFIDDEHTDVQTGVEEMYQQRMKPLNEEDASARGEILRLSLAAHLPFLKPFAETAAARTFHLSVKHPLGSRMYIDRVLLAQRSQQVFALMALLTESHRSAWELYLKLIQLYYYYVNPILASSSPDVENSLLNFGSQAIRVFHAELHASAGDYQYLRYRFELPWRRLFLHVRHYLNLDEVQDEERENRCEEKDEQHLSPQPTTPSTPSSSCSSTPPPPQQQQQEQQQQKKNETTFMQSNTQVGTVCFAATLLHSMELFERCRPLQIAVRETELWLRWFYKTGRQQLCETALSSQTKGDEPFPEKEPQEAHESAPDKKEYRGEDTALSPANAEVMSHINPSSTSVYVPMQWTAAQEDNKRAAVYWARRQHKLAIMAAADKQLLREKRRQSHSLKTKTEEGSDVDEELAESSVSSECGEAKNSSTSDKRHAAGCAPPTPLMLTGATTAAATLVDTESEEEDGEQTLSPDTYRVVNVGCFGFSFRSLFD